MSILAALADRQHTDFQRQSARISRLTSLSKVATRQRH